MAAFIYRGLQWKEAQAEVSNPTQEQPEFITEENDVSRWVKRDFIDEYGDKWPWLKEVWDYTNREDLSMLPVIIIHSATAHLGRIKRGIFLLKLNPTS